MPDAQPLQVEVDAQAREWLESHHGAEGLVIDYDVHRCCGGGKICEVRIHQRPAEPEKHEYARSTTPDGLPVLIDRRAASRLPRRFGLTVKGLGPWKRLDLRLEPDEWGELLWS